MLKTNQSQLTFAIADDQFLDMEIKLMVSNESEIDFK
jgi:hypothetical protein